MLICMSIDKFNVKWTPKRTPNKIKVFQDIFFLDEEKAMTNYLGLIQNDVPMNLNLSLKDFNF